MARDAPWSLFLSRLWEDPNVAADKLQIMLTMQRELIVERRREAFQTAFVESGLIAAQADDGPSRLRRRR
jgi:hypothetical protein